MAVYAAAFAIGVTIALLGRVFYRPKFQNNSESEKPQNLQIPTSTRGIQIPLIYGKRKVAGNLIWYDNFQVHEHIEKQSVEAGKGGGGGAQDVSYTYYTYSVSFAFAICMTNDYGANLIKIYNGDKEIDWVGNPNIRFYDGTQTTPDPHISALTERPPVYKNVAYIVFENYNLGSNPAFPSLSFEVAHYPMWTPESRVLMPSALYNTGIYKHTYYRGTILYQFYEYPIRKIKDEIWQNIDFPHIHRETLQLYGYDNGVNYVGGKFKKLCRVSLGYYFSTLMMRIPTPAISYIGESFWEVQYGDIGDGVIKKDTLYIAPVALHKDLSKYEYVGDKYENLADNSNLSFACPIDNRGEQYGNVVLATAYGEIFVDDNHKVYCIDYANYNVGYLYDKAYNFIDITSQIAQYVNIEDIIEIGYYNGTFGRTLAFSTVNSELYVFVFNYDWSQIVRYKSFSGLNTVYDFCVGGEYLFYCLASEKKIRKAYLGDDNFSESIINTYNVKHFSKRFSNIFIGEDVTDTAPKSFAFLMSQSSGAIEVPTSLDYAYLTLDEVEDYFNSGNYITTDGYIANEKSTYSYYEGFYYNENDNFVEIWTDRDVYISRFRYFDTSSFYDPQKVYTYKKINFKYKYNNIEFFYLTSLSSVIPNGLGIIALAQSNLDNIVGVTTPQGAENIQDMLDFSKFNEGKIFWQHNSSWMPYYDADLKNSNLTLDFSTFFPSKYTSDKDYYIMHASQGEKISLYDLYASYCPVWRSDYIYREGLAYSWADYYLDGADLVFPDGQKLSDMISSLGHYNKNGFDIVNEKDFRLRIFGSGAILADSSDGHFIAYVYASTDDGKTYKLNLLVRESASDYESGLPFGSKKLYEALNTMFIVYWVARSPSSFYNSAYVEASSIYPNIVIVSIPSVIYSRSSYQLTDTFCDTLGNCVEATYNVDSVNVNTSISRFTIGGIPSTEKIIFLDGGWWSKYTGDGQNHMRFNMILALTDKDGVYVYYEKSKFNDSTLVNSYIEDSGGFINIVPSNFRPITAYMLYKNIVRYDYSTFYNPTVVIYGKDLNDNLEKYVLVEFDIFPDITTYTTSTPTMLSMHPAVNSQPEEHFLLDVRVKEGYFSMGQQPIVTPPSIFLDIYKNGVFGCGLQDDLLDADTIADAHKFCFDSNITVAPIYDKGIVFLDATQELNNVHFGYLQLNSDFSKIQYRQFKQESLVNDNIIDIDYDVIGEPEFSQNISEFYNRVKIKYTKQDDNYSVGVVMADDEFSFEENGIKDTTVNLPMIVDAEVAQKIANTYLSINKEPETKVSFKVSYKTFNKALVGNIVYLYDESNQIYMPIKITKITESEDEIEVEGLKFDFGGLENGTPPSYIIHQAPSLFEAPEKVEGAIICELPPYLSGEKVLVGMAIDKPDDNEGWAGVSVYESINDNEYFRTSTITFDGTFGSVIEVGSDYLIAIVNNDSQFMSYNSYDQYLVDDGTNLIFNNNSKKFMRFGKATLLEPKKWKFGWIIDDVYGFSTNRIVNCNVGDLLVFHKNLKIEEKSGTIIGKSVDFAFPSFNFAGDEQEITSAETIDNFIVEGYGVRPLPVENVLVNGSNFYQIDKTQPCVVSWISRNRFKRDADGLEDYDFVDFKVVVKDWLGNIVHTENTVQTSIALSELIYSSLDNHIYLEIIKRGSKYDSKMVSVKIKLV
jgi:hypothetical protein